MSEILKFIFGFMGILFVGVLGIVVSSFFRLGDAPASTSATIDNVSSVR
ncbi:MAG: hypothetical protein AAB552_01840 [Patescibacteria group bacterium]